MSRQRHRARASAVPSWSVLLSCSKEPERDQAYHDRCARDIYTGLRAKCEYDSLPRRIPCSGTVGKPHRGTCYIERISSTGVECDLTESVDRAAAGHWTARATVEVTNRDTLVPIHNPLSSLGTQRFSRYTPRNPVARHHDMVCSTK